MDHKKTILKGLFLFIVTGSSRCMPAVGARPFLAEPQRTQVSFELRAAAQTSARPSTAPHPMAQQPESQSGQEQPVLGFSCYEFNVSLYTPKGEIPLYGLDPLNAAVLIGRALRPNAALEFKEEIEESRKQCFLEAILSVSRSSIFHEDWKGTLQVHRVVVSRSCETVPFPQKFAVRLVYKVRGQEGELIEEVWPIVAGFSLKSAGISMTEVVMQGVHPSISREDLVYVFIQMHYGHGLLSTDGEEPRDMYIVEDARDYTRQLDAGCYVAVVSAIED